VAFINDHREAYGVESICRVVPIAPSTYHRHRARQRNPTKRSVRAVRDAVLKAIIQRIWREHDQAYGSRRVWKQTERNGLGGTRVSSRPTCGRGLFMLFLVALPWILSRRAPGPCTS